MSILIVLLIVLWGVGMLTAYTLGGLLHLLLVVAVLVVLARFVRGGRGGA